MTTNESNLIYEVFKELSKATSKFGSFKNSHEGYAVLLEEVDELWEQVKRNPKKFPDRAVEMRKEAIQVAAMAMRFVMDVCDKTEQQGAKISGCWFYNE